jgi:sulfatase maturation enzyme AslB (radical SAM superfamily)
MRQNSGISLCYQVLTNLNCNLACTYCYENKGQSANNIRDIKEYLSALYERDFGAQDADRTRQVIIELIGGETLMYPEMLDELSSYALELEKQYKIATPFMVSISTNGTLITRPDVEAFLKKWAERISLGFSIDGTQETHDACRIDAEGRGSYDRALEGLETARKIICPMRIGVKATYTHQTIDRWAEGVINLIALGFSSISANVVFEEVWILDDGISIANQMCAVVDHLFEHKMQDKVHIFQINNEGLDMTAYGDSFWKKDQNHCGTCTHMRCLGFDRQIYGCNRFCTMKNPIPIGVLKDTGIEITNQALIDEVQEQYKAWPDECRNCDYGGQCPSCSAIPYEQDGTEAFFARKGQCGFTHAIVLARLYFREKIKKLERRSATNDISSTL